MIFALWSCNYKEHKICLKPKRWFYIKDIQSYLSSLQVVITGTNLKDLFRLINKKTAVRYFYLMFERAFQKGIYNLGAKNLSIFSYLEGLTLDFFTLDFSIYKLKLGWLGGN